MKQTQIRITRRPKGTDVDVRTPGGRELPF